MVLDADALNLIAGDATLAAAVVARCRHRHHAASCGSRRAGRIGTRHSSDRLGAALALAARFNTATVLKGAGSVLAFPDGTWAINASGNAGLASGGTGDVLAGILGALLVQGLPVKEALKLAVCLHGAAADSLVAGGIGPLGLTASELAPARSLLNRSP
jgi:NAD(P)H-hydrate repair Nnr-like enzyme with NAD(P)H-hydrate dehydratase domain